MGVAEISVPRCPDCSSTRLQKRIYTGLLYCKHCLGNYTRAECRKAGAGKPKTHSGSGQIAGKIIYPGYVYGGTRLS